MSLALPRFCHCCILIVLFLLSCNGKYAFVTWRNDNVTVSLTDYFADIPDDHVARATFVNKINQTGWGFLELHTSKNATNERQAFAAGYLEGYLTRDLIWMHWYNMLKGYCYNKTEICGRIEEFIDRNEKYVTSQVKKYADNPYWYQVKLYYLQLEALAYGYNAATSIAVQKLTFRDIFWVNMLGDMDDLALSLTLPKENSEGNLFGADHCTGLVKLLPDLTDLYISQVTWNSYQSMLRIQKKYIMNLSISGSSQTRIPGYQMALSSYPAFVQSTDDFYIISSGLVAAETTIGNSNAMLYENVKPVGQMFEFVRAMVANRLATSGQQWVELFRKHNSGTYNNQWYVVDYKRFSPRHLTRNATLKPGLLWVVEQLPGYTEAADLTELLKRTTYFPSYNIPYFPRVFNLSGGPMRLQLYGDWFAYDKNPRGKIIKQKQATIHNLLDMYYVMRYNDFKHDPLARCPVCTPPYSGCNAIAARNDLNPANGTYPFRGIGHRSHGATDAKITSYWLHKGYQFIAIASPTHNISRGIPPFKWTEFDMGTSVSHLGHPNEWAFRPMVYQWEWE